MSTFTKTIIKEGSGAGISVGQNVTVEANLYVSLRRPLPARVCPLALPACRYLPPCALTHTAARARAQLAANNTAIWSTHASSGFLFPSASPTPFTYSSGTGGVIKGWDDGVGTMKLGERATINIPWEHAYGAAGHPGFKIPAKAALRFEIEVLKIQ